MKRELKIIAVDPDTDIPEDVWFGYMDDASLTRLTTIADVFSDADCGT